MTGSPPKPGLPDSLSHQGFNNVVYSIVPATDGSGDVYVGGSFILYGTAVVDRMIRLSPTGVSK